MGSGGTVLRASRGPVRGAVEMQQQPALAFPPPTYVDLSGFRMAYRELGPLDAPQTVVLIHGITGAAVSWNEVAPALGRHHRVLAVDLKGHGDSGRPASGYRFEEQVGELAAFCTALGIHSPAVVGHSWGGAIALQLATSTDLVHRLVLEDPEIGQPASDPRWSQWTAEFETFVGWVGLSREEAQRRAAGRRAQGWSDAGVAGMTEATVKGSPAAIRSNFAENVPWDLHPLLSELRCPTLLLYAAPERGGIVDAHALALADANPHVRAVLVPGADHGIHRTRFAEFMALVEPFLAGEADLKGS